MKESVLKIFDCRLNPTGTEISRVLQKDMVLGNYRVPKDVSVFFLFSF